MFCPFCEDYVPLLRDTFKEGGQTTMGYLPPGGHMAHFHDGNRYSFGVQCKNGHKMACTMYKGCRVDGCKMEDSPRITFRLIGFGPPEGLDIQYRKGQVFEVEEEPGLVYKVQVIALGDSSMQILRRMMGSQIVVIPQIIEIKEFDKYLYESVRFRELKGECEV